MGEQITAREAAGRLGVDVRTLYAYVSRGSLHRSGADGNRRSLYDADEVELLARRGRPRSTGRSRAGIDVVIGSSISAIGDGWIRYRGIDPVLLVADGWTFERVAALLWNESADTIDGTDWTVPRETVRAIGRTLGGFGSDANVLDRMTAAMAVAAGIVGRAGRDRPGRAGGRSSRTNARRGVGRVATRRVDPGDPHRRRSDERDDRAPAVAAPVTATGHAGANRCPRPRDGAAGRTRTRDLNTRRPDRDVGAGTADERIDVRHRDAERFGARRRGDARARTAPA